VNPATLPYDAALVEWLSSEHQRGRRLVLCTASDDLLARPVAHHLKIFDEVIANQDLRNLAGACKRDALVERFGERGFDYAGNSSVDLHVWRACRAAILVNAPAKIVDAATRISDVARVFPRAIRSRKLFRTLRMHQWIKNVLIFVPIVASHRILEPRLFLRALLMFGAFCLSASSAYVLNDLLDVDSDRAHPTKRFRPFADGSCSPAFGLALVPFLTLASFALAVPLGAAPVAVLAIYLLGTVVYSCYLKRKALLDVFTLSLLYTLRLGAGHACTGIVYSPWLLSFCIFIFLSLAFSKRFSELRIAEMNTNPLAGGRGYWTSDTLQINVFGIASGFLSSLVLTLYIDSPAVTVLYRHPMCLWLLCPVLLYWISRIWLIAARGGLTEDPIMFAATDPVTYGVTAFAALVILAATVAWPPIFEGLG
jgi:4-hydroxybenzoate polyprenyltransferase